MAVSLDIADLRARQAPANVDLAAAQSDGLGCHAGKDAMVAAAEAAGMSETLAQLRSDYPQGPHDQPQSMCPAFGSLRVGLRMRRTATIPRHRESRNSKKANLNLPRIFARLRFDLSPAHAHAGAFEFPLSFVSLLSLLSLPPPAPSSRSLSFPFFPKASVSLCFVSSHHVVPELSRALLRRRPHS